MVVCPKRWELWQPFMLSWCYSTCTRLLIVTSGWVGKVVVLSHRNTRYTFWSKNLSWHHLGLGILSYLSFNVFLHHYSNNESLHRKRWNLVEHLKNQWGKIIDLFAKSIFQLLVAGSSDARRFGFHDPCYLRQLHPQWRMRTTQLQYWKFSFLDKGDRAYLHIDQTIYLVGGVCISNHPIFTSMQYER
jgi:hypothetical protein